MKFIWNEPEKGEPPFDRLPRIHWDAALLGWLNYNGVWPERSLRQHWECSYNYNYHFFDMTIYECWLPGHGEPDRAIRAMRDYLSKSNLKWKQMSTFAWDNGSQRPGVRFWVYAEDYQKEKA